MGEVIFNSFIFVLIIATGYLFKRFGILKKEDSNVLATIIMDLTLPCVFLAGADGIEMNRELFLYMLLGFAVNLVMIGASSLLYRRREPLMKGCMILTSAGYDIGNFVLPFIAVFFPGQGMIYLCAFSVGNTIMAMGVTYAMAGLLSGSGGRFDGRALVKSLLSSVSFDVYIVILIIACFHLSIPEPVLKITSVVGSANTFLVMMMIGLKLDFHMDKAESRSIVQIMATRYGGAVVLIALTFLLPIPLLAKKVFTVTYFGPMVSISSVYARRLGYEGNMVANASMVSIMAAMAVITGLLVVFV